MLGAVEISGAYASLKAAKHLLKVAFDAKVDAEAKPKVYEAMERLGSALDTLYAMRGDLFELQEANNNLRQELANSKAWQAESEKYSLVKTAGGAVVYQFKESRSTTHARAASTSTRLRFSRRTELTAASTDARAVRASFRSALSRTSRPSATHAANHGKSFAAGRRSTLGAKPRSRYDR